MYKMSMCVCVCVHAYRVYYVWQLLLFSIRVVVLCFQLLVNHDSFVSSV